MSVLDHHFVSYLHDFQFRYVLTKTFFYPISIPNLDTAFNASKVIRLKRSNLFERYKSLLVAQQTGLLHAYSESELSTVKSVTLNISVQEMLRQLSWEKEVDEAADEWARNYSSKVLFVDYQWCKFSPNDCRTRMISFLGMDATILPEKDDVGVLAFKARDPLDGVVNKKEVAEALRANGWSSFLNATAGY